MPREARWFRVEILLFAPNTIHSRCKGAQHLRDRIPHALSESPPQSESPPRFADAGGGAAAQVLPKEWTTVQNIVGGFAAGMFGAVFNTPGDVIRSAQQKQVRRRSAGPFSWSLPPSLPPALSLSPSLSPSLSLSPPSLSHARTHARTHAHTHQHTPVPLPGARACLHPVRVAGMEGIGGSHGLSVRCPHRTRRGSAARAGSGDGIGSGSKRAAAARSQGGACRRSGRVGASLPGPARR